MVYYAVYWSYVENKIVFHIGWVLDGFLVNKVRSISQIKWKVGRKFGGRPNLMGNLVNLNNYICQYLNALMMVLVTWHVRACKVVDVSKFIFYFCIVIKLPQLVKCIKFISRDEQTCCFRHIPKMFSSKYVQIMNRCFLCKCTDSYVPSSRSLSSIYFSIGTSIYIERSSWRRISELLAANLHKLCYILNLYCYSLQQPFYSRDNQYL